MWRTCADRLRRRIASTGWSRALRALVRGCVGWLFSLRGALALLTLVAVVAIAAAFHLVRRGRLERRIVEEYDRANAQYGRGELAGARDRFGRALGLIDSLGAERHFLEAEIRRKYHESRVMTDLLVIDLAELARRAYAADSPEAWRETFRAEHRGRTAVFGPTTLTARPGPGGRPAMSIGYEVRTADGRRLALAFTGCDLFAGPSWKVGTRVLFAATLDRMTSRDSAGEATGPWTLHFAPDGYLLLLDKRLMAAGELEVTEEVVATIARQRRLVRE